MRSRVSITMPIGRIRFLRSASRSSATVFAETPASLAGLVAARAVLLAAFWAFCWRPRAWPPFLAAALRVDFEAVDLEAVDLRAVDLAAVDFLAVDLRAVGLLADLPPERLDPPLAFLLAPRCCAMSSSSKTA